MQSVVLSTSNAEGKKYIFNSMSSYVSTRAKLGTPLVCTKIGTAARTHIRYSEFSRVKITCKIES